MRVCNVLHVVSSLNLRAHATIGVRVLSANSFYSGRRLFFLAIQSDERRKTRTILFRSADTIALIGKRIAAKRRERDAFNHNSWSFHCNFAGEFYFDTFVFFLLFHRFAFCHATRVCCPFQFDSNNRPCGQRRVSPKITLTHTHTHTFLEQLSFHLFFCFCSILSCIIMLSIS